MFIIVFKKYLVGVGNQTQTLIDTSTARSHDHAIFDLCSRYGVITVTTHYMWRRSLCATIMQQLCRAVSAGYIIIIINPNSNYMLYVTSVMRYNIV